MAKIGFKISSRATLLLGRENLAKAEGALIELIKNTYDADASLCYIMFDTENDSLYIIDNGIGMTEDIIKNYWMLIGTENKQKDYVSNKQRIKSGEKGIGRFALDRLGNVCEIYTKTVNSNTILRWKVKWSDFEQSDKLLNEIEADLDYLSGSLTSYIPREILNNLPKIDKEIKDYYPKHIKSTFNCGTIIKISNLRDNWSEKSLNELTDYMGYLIPPKFESDKYNICFQPFLLNSPFLIKNNTIEEFDYKISATFNKSNFEITLYRNEYDLNIMPKDLFKEALFCKHPYTKKDFENGKFTYNLSIRELLNLNYTNINEDLIEKAKSIGKFKFEYVFMKLAIRSALDKERFFYKEISSYRKDWIKKNSGIKIYRDNFIVRPYGFSDSDAFDWLGLNARNTGDPTGIGNPRKTWTVLNNQSQGALYISRINNSVILDKSSREGIIENDYFRIFKQLIIAIIRFFEKDRAEIAVAMNQYYNKINQKEQIKTDAEDIAKKHKSNQKTYTLEQKNSFNNNEFKKEKDTLVKALDISNEEKEELMSELKIMRSLATNGLITTSIVHDLKGIVGNLNARSNLLGIKIDDKPYLLKLIPAMQKDDTFLTSWINVITNQIKRDKRTRKKLIISEVIKNSLETITPILKLKNVCINFNSNELIFKKRMYSSDMDTILYNLIINSCEAFELASLPKRNINISLELANEDFIIHYSDNGNGISDSFKNPYEIFDFAVTSKIDLDGKPIGTGLGMYIVASTISEYNGKYKLVKTTGGFALDINIPIGGYNYGQ